MLVAGFILLGVVGFTVLFMAVRHDITRRAGVRASDNERLRDQLVDATTTLIAIKTKVDDIGELNPILANAVRPLVDDYLVKNGSKVK